MFHRWSAPLPPARLVEVGAGAFALGPELHLLEMGRLVSEVVLLQLCCEFCGGYRIDARAEDGFVAAPPLTSVARLTRCAEGYAGVAGAKRLRAVLPFVMEGSASPMETALALLVSLPHHWGGLGIPRPQLNHRVEPGRRWRGVVPRGRYRCDLFWPERRVAVEYDSDRFHTGPERLSRDSRRRAALQAMGVTVLSVTRDQVFVLEDFRRMARALHRLLGVQQRVRCRGYATAQRRLRGQLLGFDVEEGTLESLIRFGR